MQLLIDFYGQTTVLSFEDSERNVLEIKEALSRKKFEGFDGKDEAKRMPELHLSLNGKYLRDSDCIGDQHDVESCIFRATVAGGLKGGKGGFGAMLRSQAKKKSKKTMDFGACRDLSGRRLRHVNDEILLKKWQDAKDNDQEFDVTETTKTGIDLWYLSTPNWADTGSYKPSKRKIALAPKLKSQLCKNWLESCARRKSGKPPAGAPLSWGCPKGARCEFAHGEADLNETSIQALKEEREIEKRARNADEKRTYMKGLDGEDDSYMRDMISAGMGAVKRMKKESEMEIGSEGREPNIIKAESENDQKVEKGDDKKEEDETEEEMKHTECDCPWVAVLAGSMKVTEDAEIEGYSPFGTLAVENCALGEGKWYYEAEILTLGLMQIGWANSNFQLSSDSTDGVGDDMNSYSYDGSRQMKWNKINEVYGLQWTVGDIIGCSIDISKSYVDITYYLNGDMLGNAYLIPRSQHSVTYYPVVSLEEGEKMKLNIGQRGFKHLPDEDDLASVQSYFNENTQNTDNDDNKTKVIGGEANFEPIELDSMEYSSVGKLEVLGLERLKAELNRRGLKSGGSLTDRAQRLYSVRGLEFDQIDSKLKQKK